MSLPIGAMHASKVLILGKRRSYGHAIGYAAGVIASDHPSTAITPYTEANGESRSHAIKNVMPRVRAPPRCGAVATIELIKKS